MELLQPFPNLGHIIETFIYKIFSKYILPIKEKPKDEARKTLSFLELSVNQIHAFFNW